MEQIALHARQQPGRFNSGHAELLGQLQDADEGRRKRGPITARNSQIEE